MNRNEQIDEMVEVIRKKTFYCQQECEWYKEGLCIGNCELAEENQKICTDLYDAGYRLASDVAREIFAELKTVMIDEWRYPIIAELKKKYTEGENESN